MHITETEIKRVVSAPRNHQTMQKYIQHDVVSRIEINYIAHSNYYSIKGVSDVYGLKTESFITLSATGEVENYHCGCNFSNQESACAHVGVILSKINALSIQNFPFSYGEDTPSTESWEERMEKRRRQHEIENSNFRLEQLLTKKRNHLRENFAVISVDQDCELEVSLSDDGYQAELMASFRIGHDHKYIVKDIKELLQRIEHGEMYSYGKKLNLMHHVNKFDAFSQKQIAFLKECSAMLFLDDQRYQTSFRSIPLQEKQIDRFFDLYQDAPSKYRTFQLNESDEKICIQIGEEDNYYVIEMDQTYPLFQGKDYTYCFQNEKQQTLIRFNHSAKAGVNALLEALANEEKLYVEKKDYAIFVQQVFADILDYIDIDGEIKPVKAKQYNLKLFGDIDEKQRIFFRLECIDEEKQVHFGFDEEFTQKPTQVEELEAFIMDYAEEIDRKEHYAYFDMEADQTYQFIQQAIPYLEQHCEIYVSDALKKIGKPVRYDISVGVNINHGLLEIDFESIQIPKEELGDVLNSYHRKKKFYRLKNGELLYLESHALSEADEFLGKYALKAKDIEDGFIQMNAYRAFSLADSAAESNLLRFKMSKEFQKNVNQFHQGDKETYPIPKHYESILRDYQQVGFQWFQTIAAYKFGGVLADDMGLGKTLQTICFLENIKDKKHHRVSIVICPSSILLNWEDEVLKFSKGLRCLCVMGSSTIRKQLIASCEEYDLVITSYDYMRRDYELYDALNFQTIILDEAQYIKNQKTKNAISVKKLKGDHRFALTGTPIENTLAELWSIFDFLMPGYLYNYHYFTNYFEKAIVKDGDVEKERELKKMIEPFILRRMKKEVLKELPDKVEKVIALDFNEEERKLYFAHLAQVNEQLRDQAKVDKLDSIAVLAMLTKLRQLSCEPRVLYSDIKENSSKMKGCIELIQTLKENKKKVLLFSSFTSVLDLLAESFDQASISYYQLTGATDKMKRRELVQRFQSDDTDVFLISLKAGGTGINLTSAEAVIHFDPWWNVSAQNQATDRAYRIGQHKNVQVFKLIMRDSVEEKIMELQEKKKALSDTFVEQNKGSITKLGTSEILSLFKA